MGKSDTYVFDFDGTIANTIPLCFECFRITIRAVLGLRLTDEIIQSYFGPSEEVIINKMINEYYDISSIQIYSDERSNIRLTSQYAIELFYWLYKELFHQYVCELSYSPLKDVLRTLKNQGNNIALVTGKGRYTTDITIKMMGLDSVFDVIVTDDDVSQPKPCPEGLLIVLDSLSVSRSSAVFIGDMDADVEAAHRAGIKSMGACWFGNSILHSCPDYWARTPSDIFLLSLD